LFPNTTSSPLVADHHILDSTSLRWRRQSVIDDPHDPDRLLFLEWFGDLCQTAISTCPRLRSDLELD
jgi:hypothetical protein